MKTYLLTGDVGGTNSRMSLYDAASKEPLKIKIYRNQDHMPAQNDGDNTVFQEKIITPFLKMCFEELKLDAHDSNNIRVLACLAIAGPVKNNRVVLTNLGNLVVDGTVIGNSTGTYLKFIQHCSVINDFVAQGYGCLTLQQHEVRHLCGPKTWPDTGVKVCVGAGTGLGECFLSPAIGTGIYSCFASEGGHVEYSPRGETETKMFEYMKKKFGSKTRISVERVVSGVGLANCYEFLAKEYPNRVDKKVHEEFEKAGDMQGKIVAVNAEKGTLCLEALEIMMDAYGAEVGNAAIKWIPTGGLFVTGGLTPKNIKHIEGKATKFMKAYMDKGRVAKLLDDVPCFAVMTEDLGVRGAYKCAMMDYERICGVTHEPMGTSTNKDKINKALALGVVAGAAFAVGTIFARRK